MKIAIPTRDNNVDDHFGHCEYYTIFEIDDQKKVVSQQRFDAPVGCGCKSNVIPLLMDEGVSIMLAGSMGNGAFNKLTTTGISVVRGCYGIVSDVFNSWLEGEVSDSGVGCQTTHDCAH